MPGTLQALTAAGVTFKRDDFADPKLDRPTALTVTADGRVFGHLAKWGTCHIGHTGQCVTPPSSARAYEFFHQGVVPTDDGDLPVGKITLGTGHAQLGDNAMAAAAHYDNTGAVVATVRAGEDAHGIYLAGRIVPGTSPERVDELRRSGVSGDWRGVDGSMELVAALAVNVPGFPIPRTEQLTAAGGVQSLIAAGVVAPAAPPTRDEFEAMVASAVADKVRDELTARERRNAARAKMHALTASAAADRKGAARAEVQRIAAARAGESMDLTAAAPGVMPPQLFAYWTKGAGLARWAPTAHPFTALVRALKREIKGKTDGQIKGLAANLFKATFGIWPGERAGKNPVGPGSGAMVAAAAGKRVRSMEGAKRFGVGIGQLIPEELLQKAANDAEGAGKAVADLIGGPDRKKKKDDDKKAEGTDTGKDTEGDTKPAEENLAPDDTGKNTEAKAPAEKKADAPKADTGKDTKPAKKEDPKPKDAPAPESGGLAEADTADTITTDTPPRIDAGAGTDHPMEEDESPLEGANGGKLTSFEGGIAYYDDGTQTDGNAWSNTPSADMSADFAANDPVSDPEGAAEEASKGEGLATDYPPAESKYDDQPPESPIETDIATRTDGTGPLEEDQIPMEGASGGAIVDYADGHVIYTDGTMTDGNEWTTADSAMIEAAAANRVAGMQERAAASDPNYIESDVPPRIAGYSSVMEEDEAPYAGANGGALVEYDGGAGVAVYDDGTQTNGAYWATSEAPAETSADDMEAATSLQASAHRRVLRRMGFRPSTAPTAWKAAPRRPFVQG